MNLNQIKVNLFAAILDFLDICLKGIKFCSQLISIFLNEKELMDINLWRYRREKFWEDKDWVQIGLKIYEKEIVEKYLSEGDKVLVLFCGGGREGRERRSARPCGEVPRRTPAHAKNPRHKTAWRGGNH